MASALQLNFGVRQKVYVTYTQPKGTFFLQQDTEEAYGLAELSKNIEDAINTGQHPLVSPAIGKKCFALSEDGVWYRAVVTNCSGPLITVYYVDYGNSEQVQGKNLLEASTSLFKTPYQAIQCVLADFISTTSDAALYTALEAMIVGKEFYAIVQSRCSDTSQSVLSSIPCYNVTLFETHDSAASLSSGLVEASLGHFRICNNNVVIGEKYLAYTSFDDSPGKFWIQLSDQTVELQRVMDDLNSKETVASLQPLTSSGLSAGVACTCLYEDGLYYRAEIVSIIRSEKKVNICFVDYGNCASVAIADVKQLPARLVVSPLFAVQCCLEGIKPIKPAKPDPKLGNIAWNKQACQTFNQLTQDVELEAHVISEVSPDIFGVHLVDVGKSQDIGKLLCSSRNAEVAVSKSGMPQAGAVSEPESYQYIQLELNKPYKNLFISYAESPAKVWCQPAPEPSKFEALVEDLANEAPGFSTLNNLKAGQPCCVMYAADESWCRGCIQTVNNSTQTAQVLFVDFGNVEPCKLADIKSLPVKYFSLPAQAVSFSVVGISPRDGLDWNKEAIECFQGLVMERAMNCRIVGLDPSGYPAAKMFDPLNNNKDISLELVNRGHAKVPLTSSPRSQAGSAYSGSSPARSQKGMPPRDSLKAPSSPGRHKSRSRESSQSSFRSKSSDTFSPSHGPKFNMVRLQPGQSVDGTVIHVESLTEFYIQLNSTAKDLQQLMSKMTTHCNSSEARGVRSVHQGQPLLARYSGDGCWYRAMVQSNPSKNSCMVVFVDYGNSEKVTISNLVQMPSQFLKLPIQAVRCSLDGVCIDKEVPEDAINAFGHLTIEQKFHVKVKHSTECKGTEAFVVDLAAPTGENVLSYLVEKSLIELSLLDMSSSLTVIKVPLPQLPVKESLDVMISYHETPARFFLQLSDAYLDLETLSDALNKHYSQLLPNQDGLGSVQPGTFCVAQFSEDGLWYRGRVASVDGDKAKVVYIDFGNSEDLKVSSLKALKAEFAKVPCMGVPCRLVGISEPDDCSGKSLGKFLELVEKKLVGVFTEPFSSYEDVVGVNLTDTSNPDVDVNVLDSIHSVSKPSRSNEIVIPEMTPVINCPMECSVAFVVSPGEIYCQLTSEKDVFDSLMNKMYGFYGEGREGSPVSSPTVGSYCASLYSDGSWYRGRITAISPQGLTVFYLDYGNTEEVESSSLRSLEPQFCSLPIQGIKCHLSDVEPLSSAGWSHNCISRVQNLLLEKNVSAIFSGEKGNKGYAVKLIVDGEDLAALLHRESLAKNISTPPVSKPLPTTSQSNLIQPYPVAKGSEYNVIVTCAISPLEVYVQILDEEEKLDQLMQEIASYCKNAAHGGGTAWKPGDCILAQFTEDDMWYRGLITRSTKNRSEFDVFYQDYGNSEILNESRFRSIEPRFCGLPAQAVKCRVEGAQYYKYTAESTQQFNDVLNNLECQIKCLSVSEDNMCAADFRRCDDGVDIMSLAISENIVTSKISSTSSVSANNLLCTHIFPDGITTDSFHDVVVVYAESPSNFFCQFSLNSIEALEKMMEELAEFYSSASKGTESTDYKIGDFAVAQYSEDQLWYRAVITDIKPDGVSVVFVDYGNSDTVQHSSLKNIAPQFTKLPAQAVPCCLAEVCPANNLPWSEKAIAAFNNLTLEHSCVAQVKSSQDLSGRLFKFGDGQQLEVALIDADTSKSPAEELIQLGFAVAVSSSASPAPQETTITSSTSQFTLPSLKPRETYDAFISFVESPSRFWLQLASCEESLATIQENLNQFYTGDSKQITRLVNSLPNTACCSKFSQDGGWYRSTVKARDPEGIDVLFVDYGNSEVVSPADVCSIKPEFLDWEVQAFSCYLHGCQPTEEASGWSENAIGVFNELVANKNTPLQVSIMTDCGEDGCWGVALKDGDSDVCNQLIQCGVAARKTTPLETAVAAPTIPQVKLSEGQEYSVYIAYIDSPSNFFCQLASDFEKLESLMAEISDFYNENNLEPLLEEGAYCVAQYSSNLAWYRARILSIMPDGNVLVNFIDYGNSEMVSAQHILALESQFATLPSQAVVCSIVEDDSCQFSEEVLDRFIGYDLEQYFTITVTSLAASGQYFVKLFDQEGELVNDTLFSSPAVSAPSAQSPVSSLPTVSLPPAIKSYIPLQYSVGSSVDVYVSHIVSPTSFFCQPLELSGELDDMMSNIASYTSSESCQPLPRDSLQSGMVCLGQFTEDDGWYRAVIEEVISESNALVNFVDYGNKEVVTLDRISVLPPQFAQLPLHAFHCSVFSSISSDATWNVEQAEQFRKLVPENEQFTVEVKEFVQNKNQHLVLISSEGEPIDLAPLLGQKIEPSVGRGYGSGGGLLSNRTLLQMHVDSSNVSMVALKGSKTPSRESGSDNGETESTDDGSEGKPLIQAPFKLSLAVQEVLEVYVVFVESPSLIYVQRADCKVEFDSLAEEVAQYCESYEETLRFPLTFCEGDFVLAKWSEDDQWYRGEVIGVDSASAESVCKVSFIDYGNTEVISFASLLICPKNFLELPAQAIPCSLAQVPHLDSWPMMYKDLIAEFVEGKVMQATVVLPSGQGMKPTVRLEDVETREDASQIVLGKLQEECEVGASEVIEEEEEEGVHEAEEGGKEVSAAVGETKKEEEASAEAVEIEGIQEVTEVNETQNAAPEFPKRNNIFPGAVLQVSVVSCCSPSSLTCQLSSEAEVLEEVTNKLCELYHDECKYSPISPSSIVEGLHVAAQFSEDEQWYRARIVSCGEEKLYEVVYIDFGNSETIPLDNIRPLDESLAVYPPLALECCLSGILPPSGGADFSPSATEKVLELVSEDTCTLQVTSVEDPDHCSGVLTTSHGVNIAAALIKAELCVSTAEELKLEESEEVVEDIPDSEEVIKDTGDDVNGEPIIKASSIQPTESEEGVDSSQMQPTSPIPQGVSSVYPYEIPEPEKKGDLSATLDSSYAGSDLYSLPATVPDVSAGSKAVFQPDHPPPEFYPATSPDLPPPGFQPNLPTASPAFQPSGSEPNLPTTSPGFQPDLPTNLQPDLQSNLSTVQSSLQTSLSASSPGLRPDSASISAVPLIPSTPPTTPPTSPDVETKPPPAECSDMPATPSSTPPPSSPEEFKSPIPPADTEPLVPSTPLSTPPDSPDYSSAPTSPIKATSPGDVPPDMSTTISNSLVATEYLGSSLSAGSQHSVKVIAVSTPEDFTCQLIDHESQLKELLETIASKDYKVGVEDELCLEASLPVCACCAKDDVWYRGLMVSTSSNSTMCTVQNVDSGSVETLQLERVRHLEKCFAESLPPQSVKCGLPVLLENDVNPSLPSSWEAWELNWPTSCTQHFRDIVKASMFSMEVLAANKDGTHIVRLYSDQMDVREALVSRVRDPGQCVIREEVSEENSKQSTPPLSEVASKGESTELQQQLSTEVCEDVIEQSERNGTIATEDESSPLVHEADHGDGGSGDHGDGKIVHGVDYKEDGMDRPGDHDTCRGGDHGDDASGNPDTLQTAQHEIDHEEDTHEVDNAHKVDNGDDTQKIDHGDDKGSHGDDTFEIDHEDDTNGTDTCEVDHGGDVSVTHEADHGGDGDDGHDDHLTDGDDTKVADMSSSASQDTLEYPVMKCAVGDELNLLYLSGSSPNNFTCQLKDDSPKLDALMEEIAEFVSAQEDSSSPPLGFKVGDPLLARFSEDKLWYRAEVLSHSEDGVEVLFVDYGNLEIVAVGDTTTIPQKFTSLMKQAATYKLVGKSGIVFDHAKFEELVQDGQDLVATVMSCEEDCIVVTLRSGACLDFAESIQ